MSTENTTTTTTSFAQALNDARQMIIQQQYRIKADAERIKAQQQTIVDQSTTLLENDRRMKEQAGEIQRLGEELAAIATRAGELATAKEQAEAIVNRQGERITTLQAAQAGLETQIGEQGSKIIELEAERNALQAQLPTREDEEALNSMLDLLSKRAAAKRPMIRLAEVTSDADGAENQGEPQQFETHGEQHAQAA